MQCFEVHRREYGSPEVLRLRFIICDGFQSVEVVLMDSISVLWARPFVISGTHGIIFYFAVFCVIVAKYKRTLFCFIVKFDVCLLGVGYLVDPASGICLSQGLSHASLSMSELYNETANGSVKQL